MKEQDNGKKLQASMSVSIDGKSNVSITKRMTKSVVDRPSTKRSGSAELSESGNEKSRKKPRKSHPVSNSSSLVSGMYL